MKKIIRFIAVCLLLCFCSVMFFACADNRGNGGNNGGGSTDTDPNHIRVGIMESVSERALMESLIADFKVANPEAEVEIVSYAGDYGQKLISQASAGALPDVFMTIDTLIGFFAKRNVSLALDSYFTEDELSDFYDFALDIAKVNGELHTLPRDYSKVVVYYNTKMFEECGVEKPQNGWTWAEFKAAAQKLVKTNNGVITQFGADLQLNWPASTLPILFGLGGTLFENEEGNTESNFNSAGTKNAIMELRDMTQKGLIRNNFSGSGSFTSGTCGMMFTVRSQTTNIDTALEGNWDVVSCPIMPVKDVAGAGLAGYSIAADSQKKDMAVKFLKFLVGVEGQKTLAQTGNIVPALESLRDDECWTTKPVEGKNLEAYFYNSEHNIMPIGSYLADASKVNKVTDAMNLSLENLLSCDESEIDDFLAQGEDDISFAMM